MASYKCATRAYTHFDGQPCEGARDCRCWRGMTENAGTEFEAKNG